MNKHYIRINENNFVIHCFSDAFETSIIGDICIKENGNRHYNINLLREDGLWKYKYIAGEMIETTDADFVNELKLKLIEDLRLQRDKECFTRINRSKLWYDNLTEEQLTELQTWYQLWLDVTVSKVIPIKPNWL